MILCFSGTGNSLYAARIISAVTGDEIVSLNDRLKHGGPAAFSSERPFVAVVPTHAWRIPGSIARGGRAAASCISTSPAAPNPATPPSTAAASARK